MGEDNYTEAEVRFSDAPYFNFNDKLKFDTNDVSNVYDNYGSASGFFPKFLQTVAKALMGVPFP